jgi:hypothetical protein
MWETILKSKRNYQYKYNVCIVKRWEHCHQWSQQPTLWERSFTITRTVYQLVWYAVDGIPTKATKSTKLTHLATSNKVTGLFQDQVQPLCGVMLMSTTDLIWVNMKLKTSLREQLAWLSSEIHHQEVLLDCWISLRTRLRESIFLILSSISSES